jgi:CRP-like cAMP-binding protein
MAPRDLKPTTMVIPTYWGRESDVGWQPGDVIYDHPTPLDQEGTLINAVRSLDILEDKDFSLVILACSAAEDLEKEVEERVCSLIRDTPPPVETFVISHSHLDSLHTEIVAQGMDDLADVLSLRGYSNIRNMCLFVPYILGAEIALLIDDDEYIDDPKFISKAREFIGGRFIGQTIDGVAGYYVNDKGSYYDDVPEEIHWMTYWDRFGSKREAFDKIIPGDPRLKRTPFAFGGCMVIHRSLFRSVPFDPNIPRGEDTDYVLNARMFGFDFFLDNQLYIQHRPPPKSHPTWQSFREDIFRLVYSKAKLDGQYPQTNMDLVTAEDFDPYPGEFLKDSLDDKILKSNLILALDYLSSDRVEDAKETIRNIWLAKTKAIPKYNPFQQYLEFQHRWRALRKLAHGEVLDRFLAIVLRGNIFFEEVEQLTIAERAEFERNSKSAKPLPLKGIPIFEALSQKQVSMLETIVHREFFGKDEVIIKEGSEDQKLYIITKGKARITHNAAGAGEDVILDELEAGEVMGEVSLVIDAPHSVSVTAVETTELITVERKDLFELMAKEPEFAARMWNFLAKSLGNRLRDSNDRYLTHTRERHDDVADELIGTGPFEKKSAN